MKEKIIDKRKVTNNKYLKSIKNKIKSNKDKKGYHFLPENVKHPKSKSDFYP